MSGDSTLQLQKSIYDVLRLDATLGTKATGGVHDFVPQGTAYPYVVVGDDLAEAWDTKGTDGTEVIVSIHTWSQKEGFKETKEIMAEVVRLLHNVSLVVTGHNLVLIFWESNRVLRDPDRVTSHGVQQFRVITQEV